MDFKTYLEKAVVGLKPHKNRTEAITDWVVGLNGEFGEVMEVIAVSKRDKTAVDFKELAKEIGDVLWYIGALDKELGTNVSDVFNYDGWITYDNPMTVLLFTSVQISKISEQWKHDMNHQRVDSGLDWRTYQELLERLLSLLHGLCTVMNLNMSVVAELNEAKLRHRFNGGDYSVKQSLNRHEREKKFEETEEFADIIQRIIQL